MNIDRDLDRQLSGWFDRQTTTPSPDLLPRAIARIGRVQQRPGFLTRDWYVASRDAAPAGRLLVPAVVVVIVLVAATALVVTSGVLVQPRQPVVANTKALFAPSSEVAFRATLQSAGSIPQFNWRAGAYSEYTGAGWSSGEVVSIPVAGGQPIDAFSDAEHPRTTDGLRVEVVVIPDGLTGSTLIGPRTIESVAQPVDAIAVGRDRWFTSIERARDSGPYAYSALLPMPSARPGGLNEATLRRAGSEYSPSMLAIYTQLPDDAVGPASIALLNEIRAAVPTDDRATTPYDLSRTMERYLSDPAKFAYTPDVRAEVANRCDGISTVECFALLRRGYCEYYATTMAVLLRESGIPTRVAYGFLAGNRDPDDLETVGAWLAHWWVEVYFPGVGWFEFDPTGSVGRPYTLPAGT